MSDRPKQPADTEGLGIRNNPLQPYEKKELTHYLRDLNLAPQNGQLVIHFNAGCVLKVERLHVL